MATKPSRRRKGRPGAVLDWEPEAQHVSSSVLVEPHHKFGQARTVAEHHQSVDRLTSAESVGTFWSTVLEFLLDNEEDETVRVRMFPRYAIVFLAILTFYSRYLLINGMDGLGMLQPYENFQAIEVAHSMVYGYGFCLFEDREAECPRDWPTPSWAYTGIYVALFRSREFFGWNTNPFVLARIFHGAVAVLLPISVYKFCRTALGRCRDIAFSAAVLVAFSKHLMLSGIHPSSSGLTSPLVFFLLTVILRLAGVGPEERPRTGPGGGQAAALVLCGVLVGFLSYTDVGVFLTALFVTVAFTRRAHLAARTRVPAPSLPASFGFLVATGALLAGAGLGLFLASLGDEAASGRWLEKALRPLRNLLVATDAGMPTDTSYFWYLRSFIDASQIHAAILGAALAVSLFYRVYRYRLTDVFDPWIDGGDSQSGDSLLFASTARITAVAVGMLIFYSVQEWKCLDRIHDTLVLILVSGASGAYVLYRGLYSYLLRITELGKTTRNIVKLILYAELLLYMFEARITFPTAQNKGIANWSHRGLWESAHVNTCLRYVSEQSDVTGVVIDYPIVMTGAFTLLGHDVPIWARHGHEFRQWQRTRRNSDVEMSDESLEVPKRVTMLEDVVDVVSLLNAPLLLKKVIEDQEFNYVVVTGKRKFPKTGYRKVYNASDTWVFKRSKSISERQQLSKMASDIPIGANATVLAYEGTRLLSFRLREESLRRLRAAVELESPPVEAWQLLIFAMKETAETQDGEHSSDISAYTSRCLAVHGPKCIVSDRSSLPRLDLANDLELMAASYKF